MKYTACTLLELVAVLWHRERITADRLTRFVVTYVTAVGVTASQHVVREVADADARVEGGSLRAGHHV